jgi:hypothetical protein
MAGYTLGQLIYRVTAIRFLVIHARKAFQSSTYGAELIKYRFKLVWAVSSDAEVTGLEIRKVALA